jgi:hypothetical protein
VANNLPESRIPVVTEETMLTGGQEKVQALLSPLAAPARLPGLHPHYTHYVGAFNLK